MTDWCPQHGTALESDYGCVDCRAEWNEEIVVLDRLRPARGQILLDAHSLVGDERQEQYGTPLDCHTAVAEIWSALLRRKPGLEGIKLTAEDVCWMLVMVKAAREAHAHKEDNLIDAIGYLENAEECALERARRSERNAGT